MQGKGISFSFPFPFYLNVVISFDQNLKVQGNKYRDDVWYEQIMCNFNFDLQYKGIP